MSLPHDPTKERKRIAKVKRYYAACLYMFGMDMREICLHVKLERPTVYQYVNELGVPRRGFKYKYKRKSIV